MILDIGIKNLDLRGDDGGKASWSIRSLGDYLTDRQINQSCDEICEGQNKQATAPWHPTLHPYFPISSSVWMEVSGTDVSISERVSLSVSSSAKSVAHAVWNRASANMF